MGKPSFLQYPKNKQIMYLGRMVSVASGSGNLCHFRHKIDNIIQRYSIILWRKAEQENISFEEISKDAYDVFNIFQNYPQDLRPNYMTVRTRKDIEIFDWNYKHFCEQLKKESIEWVRLCIRS